MIVASELRIGNLLKYNGLGGDINTPYEVVAISRGFIYVNGKVSLPKNLFEAIPLTEEWLLRLGFKKNHYDVFGTEYNEPFFTLD